MRFVHRAGSSLVTMMLLRVTSRRELNDTDNGATNGSGPAARGLRCVRAQPIGIRGSSYASLSRGTSRVASRLVTRCRGAGARQERRGARFVLSRLVMREVRGARYVVSLFVTRWRGARAVQGEQHAVVRRTGVGGTAEAEVPGTYLADL